MQKYANLHGNSGIDSYSSLPTSIKVKFVRGSKVYVYNHVKPGSVHVSKMKELAVAGRGLATYISQNVQKNYASTE